MKNIIFEWDELPLQAEPCKIYSCTCIQCKYVKGKRKNRKYKRTLKRLLNKKRRKQVDVVINNYWA